MARASELITQSAQTLLKVAEHNSADIERAAEMIVESYRRGGKLLICGNGGSAADAQHMAAEFVGRYLRERRPLPAHALTTNTSSLTAIGNDYGYEQVFARQVDAFGAAGDVLWVISTSGNSPNVLAAIAAGKQRGIAVIGLTGGTGGKMKPLVDLCIVAPSSDTPRIQEAHIAIGHVICDLVESALAGPQ